MTDYNIPNDFMNFSNEIYVPLYQLLQRTGRGEIRSREEAKAGIHGLMGFFHEHDRNNLERMGINDWMGFSENPDRDAVRREMIDDIRYDLKNIIEQIIIQHPDLTPDPNDPDDLRLARSITDMLVRRFGIRARGRKKPKKHTRRRISRHRRTRHRRSRHKRSRHQKRKHKKTKHRR